jgi:hypothetical protein
VTRNLRRDARREEDPFLVRRAEMGIDPTRSAGGEEATDPLRAAHRAGAFFVLNREYFRVFFAPGLTGDPERQRAFSAWIAQQAPERAHRIPRD